jgi:hypothetical protein
MCTLSVHRHHDCGATQSSRFGWWAPRATKHHRAPSLSFRPLAIGLYHRLAWQPWEYVVDLLTTHMPGSGYQLHNHPPARRQQKGQ